MPDYSAGSIDWGALFGTPPQNEAFNLSNLMNTQGSPAPQSVPSFFQPGGQGYNGLSMGGQQFVAPYNPATISSKVNQSVQAPSLSAGLQSLPNNPGVAHNSPARMYLASMRSVMPAVGYNAGVRAMLPLQYGGETASMLQSQQADLDNYRLQWNQQRQQQSQAGISAIMGILSPFLGGLLNDQEI